MSKPSTFPDWALSPPAQGSLDEQQTIAFVGTPVQGSFVLSLGTAISSPINWDDNAAAVQIKINAIYAPGTAVVTGGPAPSSFIVDFGVFSQTNFIPQMVVSSNTLVTAGNAQVMVTAQITQASQLPATVAIDTGHRDNGWSLLEFPPFNLFNQWMKNVGEWIRWFDSTTATFFGGTDTGTVDAFVLTGIVSFPANASIISGTLLSFVASTGITGDSTVSVNGQAPIQILNLDGFILQYGMIPAGMRLFLEYNGTKWILLNPRKQRRQWSLMADGSAAAGSLTSAGFTQGSFSLSGTGGSLVSDHTLISTPSVTFSATATSGHEALFTTTNLCLLVYSVMNLFIHSTSVEADGAGQGFIGYASGDPDLTGTDPLANLTGWGIWFKWTGTTVSAVSFVNNNGNATSAITAVLTGVSKFSELFTNISLNGGVFTCEVIKSGVATVVTSNTKVPATTVTSSYVIKPYIYLHNGSSNTLNMEVAEVYGDYGN